MKKTPIYFLALILLAVTIIPLAVAEPTGSDVVATQTGGFVAGTLVAHTNDGDIFFYDAELTGTVTLDILSTPANPDYTLILTSTVSASINKKTDQGVQHYTMVWSLKRDGIVVGTFEGVAKGTSTTYVYIPSTGTPHPLYSTNIMHTVLQGKGEFEGQTLKLDGMRPTLDPTIYPPAGPANPSVWEGSILMH